ncbi:hypothetical protein EV384_5850 [Micromonospora kangleipakensis]|uniref:Uncharacterized protein n=1 Tax=Micromonospora kangleipakensis TaxID=1077942 RepID=A0A4V2GDT8_9ACTN|nr:hypothetical protein [Micromonospora kangleipakensis]RZU77136.1 hypothetical protein EV384_5850 [Micromonospora kangleipakensis]
MATFPDVSINDLETAYAAWPDDPRGKTALWALILRVRIERAAANLPGTVIAAQPDISLIERRLYLSIGEPGLTHEERVRRMRVIAAGVGTYQSICELLHGRNPDPTPPIQDVEAWTAAVDNLELELCITRPEQPLVLDQPSLTTTVP